VRSLPTAIDIVKEAGIFIPFGILVSYLLVELIPAASRSRIVLLTGLVSLAFAAIVELSQAVSIGRYIDVTDILLAGGGGMCGPCSCGCSASAKRARDRRAEPTVVERVGTVSIPFHGRNPPHGTGVRVLAISPRIRAPGGDLALLSP